jgi:myosin heavy subunit
MKKTATPDDFVGFIYNLSLLEENTSQLYKSIADRVGFPVIKALLLEVSLDSQKHYRLLEGIVDSMTEDSWKTKDTQKKLCSAQKPMDEIESYFVKTIKISEDNLPELTEKLSLLESQMGEEYEVLVQWKSLVFFESEIQKKYNFNSEHVKRIFKRIITEEAHHMEILEMIKDIVHQKDQELIASDPFLMYCRLDVLNQ